MREKDTFEERYLYKMIRINKEETESKREKERKIKKTRRLAFMFDQLFVDDQHYVVLLPHLSLHSTQASSIYVLCSL